MLKQFLQFPYNLSLIEMSTEDDLRKEAIAIFYEKHENDLLDQEKCKEIVKLYENDIKRIKAEVCMLAHIVLLLLKVLVCS